MGTLSNESENGRRVRPMVLLALVFTCMITALVLLKQSIKWSETPKRIVIEREVYPPTRSTLNEDTLRLDSVPCSELASRAKQLRLLDNQLPAKEVEFPEIGIKMRIPTGFKLASRFRGLVNEEVDATIRILDGPLQQALINPYRTEEQLRMRGCIDISHRSVQTEFYHGVMVFFRDIIEEFHGNGSVYTEYVFYWFNTDGRSISISVHYPAECSESLKGLLERTLLSCRPVSIDHNEVD